MPVPQNKNLMGKRKAWDFGEMSWFPNAILRCPQRETHLRVPSPDLLLTIQTQFFFLARPSAEFLQHSRTFFHDIKNHINPSIPWVFWHISNHGWQVAIWTPGMIFVNPPPSDISDNPGEPGVLIRAKGLQRVYQWQSCPKSYPEENVFLWSTLQSILLGWTFLKVVQLRL